jgi:endonuclease/exonuclease/phosphatase family metal-dependent hydrolase
MGLRPMTVATLLTANIAYGFTDMDRLASSVRHQLQIHGWGALSYVMFPSLRGSPAKLSATKRTAYVLKHRNLGPTLEMIEQARADVVVLNEVIYELHRAELESALVQIGFQGIAWGVSTHYPGTSISTLVASKEPGTAIRCVMPQRPSMGGGAGMAGLRLLRTSRTIFGVHLTYRSPALFERQLDYIAQVAADEYARGREVIIGGDWNDSVSAIVKNPKFRSLNLVPASLTENATCPTFFPHFLRKPLDHIFIPCHWRGITSNTIAFGSDHLALAVEVRPGSSAQVAKPVSAGAAMLDDQGD